MKKMRTIGVVAFIYMLAGITSAETIFTDGFNVEDGYSNDSPLANGWMVMTGDFIPLIDATPDRAFEGSASASVSYNGGGRGAYIDFNTNPSIAEGTVTLDFYTHTGAFNNTSWGGCMIGFMEAGTENIQAAVNFYLPEQKVYTYCGTQSTESNFNYAVNTANWYHMALEVDYGASNLKVYAKEVAKGDTTLLTEADLLVFGGSDTVSFSPTNAYASRLFIRGANVFQLFDNINVILPGLAGDANQDGVVSAGDYASVQSHFGDTGPGILGDANGDGVVSAGDYDSVRSNFGKTTQPAGTVPEPMTMSLLAIIGGTAMFRRKRNV